MSILEDLKWRYAPKRMNGEKVPSHELNLILEAARLAPTSMGLQPFKMIIVEDQATRELISPIAYHQAQIMDCSHLIVFASFTQITKTHADNYLMQLAHARNEEAHHIEAFRKSLYQFLEYLNSNNSVLQWAQNQTFLAMGFALAEAASLKIDITPMEGFNAQMLNDFLKLEELHLHATAIFAVGYRDVAKDFLANKVKVRKSMEEMILNNNFPQG